MDFGCGNANLVTAGIVGFLAWAILPGVFNWIVAIGSVLFITTVGRIHCI